MLRVVIFDPSLNPDRSLIARLHLQMAMTTLKEDHRRAVLEIAFRLPLPGVNAANDVVIAFSLLEKHTPATPCLCNFMGSYLMLTKGPPRIAKFVADRAHKVAGRSRRPKTSSRCIVVPPGHIVFRALIVAN